MANPKPSEAQSIAERLAQLSEAHQRTLTRFLRRLADFESAGDLNATQLAILEHFVIRLGERERNPANTGNLEDLFCYTLEDTGDAIRAFAQLMADSVKVVPMPDDAELVPNLRVLGNGHIYKTVGDLIEHNPGERMLISHTMVAYGDDEMRESAHDFIRAAKPSIDEEGVGREYARMAAQSQHGPSSTFVLARMRGLTLDLADVYRDAGYGDAQAGAAQQFYDVCAEFDPEWVKPFLSGFVPTGTVWSSWRRRYLEARQRLPEELIYQLSSDTLTNFLDGTMESGKWTDASIFFGGVSDPKEVPSALSQIVNQYLAEHIALHDRPAEELMDAVAEPLAPWGVGFERGRAICLPGEAEKKDEIDAQFAAAWARKLKNK